MKIKSINLAYLIKRDLTTRLINFYFFFDKSVD